MSLPRSTLQINTTDNLLAQGGEPYSYWNVILCAGSLYCLFFSVFPLPALLLTP